MSDKHNRLGLFAGVLTKLRFPKAPSQRRFFVSALSCLGALLACQNVFGAAIQGVTINSYSDYYSVLPDFRPPSALVTGNGLYGDNCTTSPRNTLWLSGATGTLAYTNAFVIFDLGQSTRIDQLKIWNYNEVAMTNRGIQLANFYVAGDDMNFSQVLTNVFLNKASGTFSNFSQLVNLGATGRYVKLTITTNWGSGDGHAGLSKIRFLNTNTPPTIKRVTRSYGGTKVTVEFSETVLPSSATNAANYALFQGSNPVAISNAVMDTFADRVVLNTATTLNSNLTYTLQAQNVSESSGATAILATNVNVEAEFVLWFKGDAGVSADGGGNVLTWADQSGAGNDASPSAPDVQPAYITDSSGINGKPSVRFDGSTTGLASANNSTLVVDADLSYFAVVRPNSFATYGALLTKETLSPNPMNYPAPFDFELAVTTGKTRLLRGNGSVATTLNGTSNAIINQATLVELVIKGTNAMSWLNGFANGNAVFADGIEDQGNPVRIGRREAKELYYSGDMGEIMFMRGAISDTERTNIEAYLARKWGFVTPFVGPPIINTQPTNFLSYVGYSATFTAVLSTNGSSPKSSQWYLSPNTPVTGATNSSLTLSNLTIGQNNTVYYLTITNVDGSTSSTNATLTVLPLTAPFFTVQPLPQTAYKHQPVSFSAVALGSPGITYQWYYNNTAIENATNLSLTIQNLALNNTGNISVVASNSFGMTTSTIVALTVVLPATNSYAAGIATANPALYYPLNDINGGSNVTANYGSLGAAFNGSLQGTWSADNGPQPPSFPMFDSTNLAFGNASLAAGGVQFPLFPLNNTAGGAHCTFAAWIYDPFGQSPNAGILFTRATGSGVCGIAVNQVSGNDEFIYTWNNGQFGFHTGLYVPLTQWTFVAAAIEPTRTILYMNTGDGSGFHTATNTAAAAAVAGLGGYVGWDSFAAARRWFGDIDEPMIFDRALSSNEVAALYTTSPLAPTATTNLTVVNTTNGPTITWPKGYGTLQKATNVSGPYSDMFGITSPFILSTNDSGFYRLRVQ